MITVVITLADPDPDVAPLTFPDAVAAFRPLLSGEIQETLTTYIIGSAVPNVDDQDKVWVRLDPRGAPLGNYTFFSGVWVRETPPISARFGFFTGDPTVYFDGTGAGLKGAGPVAMDYWGWQLMNGENGTPNLSNRFLIMGAMDNVDITGFSGSWRTNINGVPETTGGNSEVTLDESNTFQPARAAGAQVSPFSATGQARVTGGDHSGDLYGGTGDGTHDEITLFPEEVGVTSPDAISIVNPFYAMAIVQFVGYV